MTRADSDRPPYARVVKRRNADIAFLERVRAADLEELRQMEKDFAKGPKWKQVSVARMIARGTLGAT